MTVSFNIMPVDLRVPGQYAEIDNSQAFRGLSGIPTKLLLIGQRLATGTVDELDVRQLTSADQARLYFGAGSQLAHMAEKAFAAVENGILDIWAIAQDDLGAGVQATGTLTVAGTATTAGIINIYIAGRRIRVLAATTDTAANIATNIAAAINADTDLPVTAEVNGGTAEQVDITANHKGENGNDIDVRVNYYSDELTPDGLTITIVAMANGAGNPDLTDVITIIGDEWYTDICAAYTDTANIVVLEGELTERFGPLKMIDAHGYMGLSGTHSALTTKGDGRNSPHNTMIGSKGAPNPPYEWAASLAAVCSYQGKQDPARPMQTLSLPGILAPKIEDRFTLLERDLLLRNGISTFRVSDDGTVRIERVITTYSENEYGAADPSFLDLTTLKTVTYLRFDLRTFMALRYPRFKLADDGTRFSRGANVATPKMLKGSIIARFGQWEDAGLVENVGQFKNDLVVERDPNDPNRVNALVPPDIVNQLRVFAALIQFRL